MAEEVRRRYEELRVEDVVINFERKKATRWTEEEHRRFLMGLVRFGKGDWKSISRYAVKTRTSTQVASHAQKFFLRQINYSTKKDTKRKQRSSILDINFSFSDFLNINNNVQHQQKPPVLDTPDFNFSFSSDFPNISNNVQDQETSPVLDTPDNFSFSGFPADFLDNFFSDDNTTLNNFPNYPPSFPDQQKPPVLLDTPNDNFSFSDLSADQQIDHVMVFLHNFSDDNFQDQLAEDLNTSSTLNNFPHYPPNFPDQQTQDMTIPMDKFPSHPTNFPADQQLQGGAIGYPTDYIDEQAQLDNRGGGIGYPNNYLDQNLQLAQGGEIWYSTNYPREQVQPARGGGIGYLTNFPDWQTGWQAFTEQEDGFQDFAHLFST